MVTTAKLQILQLIEEQPEDSTFEEILRELALARMIERGLADSTAQRTVTNEEMQRKIKLW